MNNTNIFKRNGYVQILAMIAVISWAFAFPLIKIGFEEFSISSNDNWSKALFAGIRFFAAGLLLILFAKMIKLKFSINSIRNAGLLFLFSLIGTALHYFFFYLGLSYMDGSRSALYDSLSTFLLIILACFCFSSDRMTYMKAIGCIFGFFGILIININKSGFSLLFPGDMFMLLNSICSAIGGLLTRVVTKRMNPLYATGYSLLIGGVILIGVGFLMGGRITSASVTGVLVLIALILISAIGFSLYNMLILYNPVGKIAIFNSFIPVLGAMLSCLILKERFSYRYVISAICVTAGVFIINSEKAIIKE